MSQAEYGQYVQGVGIAGVRIQRPEREWDGGIGGYAGLAEQAKVPEPEGSVRDRITALDREIEHLNKALCALEVRLAPALRNEIPQETRAVGYGDVTAAPNKVSRAPQCDAAQRIQTAIGCLADRIYHVNRLRERIEL